MKKRLPAFSLCVLMILLLLSPAAYAGDADAGTRSMGIGNRKDENATFSCDVTLTGAKPTERVFAVLYAESRQVKNIQRYPAETTFHVSLSNVDTTDEVRFYWLDEHNMPVAEPEVQLMSGNGKVDYATYGEKLSALIQKTQPDPDKADPDKDIISGVMDNRLLVSCDKPMNWRDYGLNENDVIEMPNHLYVLQFSDSMQANDYEDELVKHPSVRYVEHDTFEKFEKLKTEDDEAEVKSAEPPQWHSWGITESGFGDYVKELQKNGHTSQQIVVAVVDTGVDKNHVSFNNRLLEGYSFLGDPSDYRDEHEGHGTHVTGIIVECTKGMENVKILPVRVIGKNGLWTPSTITAGIYYAADHGAHIINLSLRVSQHIRTIEEAIQYALSKGITVVVAAGNDDDDAQGFCPTHMEKCIAVAAVERNGTKLQRWANSNYGEIVDIAAAGCKVDSCCPSKGEDYNRYKKMSGTSMAAPHVAAAALLMCERGTSQTPFDISNALKGAATMKGVKQEQDKPIGAGFLDMRPFIEQTATVTFHANGGTGSMEPLKATVGKPVTLPLNAFTRDGYYFVNWNTKADGTGISYKDKAQFTPNADTTLYAQWTEVAPHALLYDDGTLDFRNSNIPAPGKTLVKSYSVPMTESVIQSSPWDDAHENVKRVTFSEAMRPRSTALWFCGFEKLTEVSGLDKLDTSQTTDMSKMFARCTALTTLDLSALNTSGVTNMKAMFNNCTSLTELNLTGWNTANVTEMSDMFKGCKKLAKVYASDSFAPGQGVMTPFDFTAPVNADMTVYANWVPGSASGLVIGSGTVDVSDTNAVIPITIEKRGNTGAAVLQFDVVFPDELILDEKPIVGDLFADKELNQEVFTSPYTISLGDDTATTDTTAEGVLVTLNFKLRPGAAPGAYNITIQEQDNYNANVDPVTFPVTDGCIEARSDGSGLVVGTGSVSAGDTDTVIPVTIEKKGAVGAAALQFDVVFPDELILAAKPEVGTLFEDKGLHQDVFTSPYTISLGNDTATTNVTAEGVLVTLYFKVKPGAPAGHYDITLESQDNYSANVDSVTFPVTPGRITVSSGAAALMAGDDSSLVVGSGTVKTGEADTVIPITIDKTGFAGAAALQFDVVFPDALILTEKPTVGTLFADKGLHQSVFTSPYTISLGNDTATEDTTTEGNLVTLYFKVRQGTAPGKYNITIQGQDNYNANVDSVTFGVSDGAITVLPNGETVVVTFDANGGTFNGKDTTKQVTIGKGNTVTPPVPAPTRDGYSLTGWFTSGAGKVSNSAGMFSGCAALAGQQGTTYDPAHTDITYARIDGGTSKPGYFSKK